MDDRGAETRDRGGWLFAGGFLVGILVGVLLVVVISRIDGRKSQGLAIEAAVKGTGLILAIFFAKPVIVRMLAIARVPFPELSVTETAVGATIGYIERFLAYSFVLDGSDNAISMLIEAKGIYRIHELGLSAGSLDGDGNVNAARSKENKIYYVMIGTFSSIAYAIAIGFAAKKILEASA